jgi:hypothetical protein
MPSVIDFASLFIAALAIAFIGWAVHERARSGPSFFFW